MKKNLKLFEFFTSKKFNKILFRGFCQNLKIEKLKKTLNQEINFEENELKYIDNKFIKEFLEESKFNLEEIPNSNKFILTKKEDNFVVEVSCNSRAPIKNDNNNEESEENSKNYFF